MKQGDRDYLAAADVLRVVAIGLIGWYHIWQQSWLDPSFMAFGRFINIQNVVRHGYLLVDVVLVISGFLLAIPYARAGQGLAQRPSTGEFYKKRFWRIVPSYMLAVLLCLFLWAVPRREYTDAAFLAKDLFTHFTFTHNLFYDTYFATPLQVVLWTMGVEVQFYLIFPLIARGYEKSPALVCFGMTLAAAVYRLCIYTMEDSAFWINQLPSMLDLYAVGMLAGYVYAQYARREIRDRVRWALAGCALLCLFIMFQYMYMGAIGDYVAIRRQQLAFRMPLGLAAGGFLVCGCLAPPKLNRILGNPVTRYLSAISFNFYMWHQTLAVWLKALHIPSYAAELPNQASEQPWQTRYTWLCFAAAISVATVITYLWEKPLARWGRGSPVPSPAAAASPETMTETQVPPEAGGDAAGPADPVKSPQ